MEGMEGMDGREGKGMDGSPRWFDAGMVAVSGDARALAIICSGTKEKHLSLRFWMIPLVR